MRLSAVTVFTFVFLLTGAAYVKATPSYVGIDGCKCHKSEITDWERSKHAKAFELLQSGKHKSKKKAAGLDADQDYTDNENCVKCHVTGYKKDGGYKDKGSTPELSGVGCEMCHGPGSEYRKIHKEKTTEFTRDEAMKAGQTYGSVDISVCKACHEHKDSPFTPKLDEKYRLDLEKALKDARAFHRLYPTEGKH